MRVILRAGSLIACLFLFSAVSRGQVFDNQCPAMQSSIVPLRTVNIANGHFNDTACADTNGNLIFQALNASLSASDTFTRANGPLGLNWTVTSGNPTISSNAVNVTSLTFNMAIWSNLAFASTAQFAQVSMVGTPTAGASGPVVFGANSAYTANGGTGYVCTESSTLLAIQRLTTSTTVTLTSSAITGVSGDTVRLEITSAGAMTCYLNGASILTTTDTNFKSGSPGIFLKNNAGISPINNWSGGSLPVSNGTGPTLNAAQCKVFEGIPCVDANNTAGWPGADIGAWINAAYATLPASGGTIFISGGTLASPASFTTPVVAGTVNKPVLFQCLSGAVLKFTPNSGTAFSMNWLGVGEGWSGMRDCTLLGSGSAQTATAISVNGRAAALSGLKFASAASGTSDGFGTAISITTNGYISTIEKNFIAQSTTCLTWSIQNEGTRVINNTFSHCGTAVSQGVFTGENDVYFTANSFDDCLTTCITVNTGANTYISAGHFENVDFVGGATENYISAQGTGQVFLKGVSFLDDRTSGTQAQWIQMAGSSILSMDCSNLFSSAGETVTQAVLFSGSARGEICNFNSTSNISAPFNTAYVGGPVIWTPQNLFTTASKIFASNNLPILEGNATPINAGSCTVESNHLHVFCGTAGGQTSTSFFQPGIFNWRIGMPAGSSTWTWANTATLITPLMQLDQTGLLRLGVTNAAGTTQTLSHIVQDTATLAAGTVTVTFSGSAVFTNATSYTCIADDDTAIGATRVLQNSGSSITITGTGTDVIRYICVGN